MKHQTKNVIAKITSAGIKVYKVNQLLWESARVYNINTEVCDQGNPLSRLRPL
jgi:hypothetical protein